MAGRIFLSAAFDETPAIVDPDRDRGQRPECARLIAAVIRRGFMISLAVTVAIDGAHGSATAKMMRHI
jgi:hypothetical protein